MPDSAARSRRGPVRAAVAALTAALVLAGTAACDDKGAGGAGGSAAKPTPKPTPTSAWNTRPASLASLGDSITRGFNACSPLADCPEASWATGTAIDSLARRLLPSPAGKSWNYAKSGARMADLPGQLAQALPREPELVTVEMGANDACRADVAAMTSVDQYRADFTAALKNLRRSLPKTQVYVAGVPDLKRLWAEGRADPLGKQVWKLARICPSMLGDADAVDAASTARRGQVEQRVAAYNAVLKEVCGKDPLCRYDGAVNDFRFTGAELSQWDWFHPSKEGQRELAAMAYRKITEREPAA
ncbi:SGNH/GDSL hydrolase family protein [Streptomyces varsoviensis]|uniref:SGNH/GDSL hydrolase family protein n=1 Tax=Streptomyces varsoviensis TaxID=67373 RepID=UPI0033D612BD